MTTNLTFESQQMSITKPGLSIPGKILIGISGGFAVGLSIICAPFISPALRKVCLPYVPATDKQILNVLQGLKGRSGKLVDLGSGDGRIVIEAAKHEFEAHGVELNPWLVLYSKYSAFRSGLRKNTNFFRRNLWNFSVAPYNNVVIFGVEEMMKDLETKIVSEVKKGTIVIACRFPMQNWEPEQTIGSGVDTVWVYRL